jgi:hypothetical protein
MPDPAERFLAAAVAPLADDAELQVMARRELEEFLAEGEAEALEGAADALESAKRRRGWKIALYAVTAIISIVSLGLLGRMMHSIQGFRMMLDPLAVMGISDDGKMRDHLGKNLNAEQRLLLFGDTSKTNPAERFKALWDSDPENPAYFADYSLHYIQSHGSLPPDFLGTAAKLDPDNAWFTVVAAGATAKRAVERQRLTKTQVEQGILNGYKILDQARLDEAVRLLERASSQRRFDSYQTELMTRRITLLPARSDFASQLPGRIYLSEFPSGSFHLSEAMKATDAAAWQAADQGDSGRFRQIAEWWELNLQRWVKAPCPDIIHELVLQASLNLVADRLGKTTLPDLKEINERWKPVSDRILADKEESDRRDWDVAPKLRGGMIAGLSLPLLTMQLKSPIPITDADLKPGRLVDHEWFARLSAALVWLILWVTAVEAMVYRRRSSLMVRCLSGRLVDLLKSTDWAWILGAGVVLPFLFYLAIYRLTPLGARDWSIAASAFLVPAGQVAAMGFLMIVLPVLVARWRLGKRGAMLGWRKGRPWMGWTAVICGALSLPVFGLSFASGKGSEAVMMIAATLLGILVLTWLVLGLRAVFSKRPALLRRVTLSRVLVPAYALGMLLMATSMPLYHAAEKRWLAQDRLMEITPEAPAMSRYEWEVAQAMRAELLEVLGTK